MKTNMTTIGLPTEYSEKVSKRLNDLLAAYQVFYINTRGFHWNIKGEKFFELHLKFEELYTDFQVKIDEIAERVLTLGYTPTHSYSSYLKDSVVKESQNVSDGKQAVEEVVKAFQNIILIQREILNLSGDADDEGTNALMSDYIREQEKLVWMYSAFLNR